ncbi:F0F1 ATP synthase subunit A [Luteolibacter luteus]|uniref:ATP synthase subunit a n=2 Tax=Luteolibacter luteus TaxID=2728835 RepID=A0A858RRF7_9BACT|nr:F0F1 ATP synthase subunit A [Luteolibacter luteus]
MPVFAAEGAPAVPEAAVEQHEAEHDAGHAAAAHGEGADAHAAEGGHHALPLNATPLHSSLPISNSILMVWLAVGIIILFCRAATKKMSLIPTGFQNFAEWAVESLYDFLSGLMGKHLTLRTFWFFGTVFFFILVNNYMGLIPGVGTVGWKDEHGHMIAPWLRGANADINMTAAMAFSFAGLWFYWALTENSVKQFFAHIFAPKGSFAGAMLAVMVPVFLFVGVLEVISIMIRPVALTFRLFGNIYGGEQTLESLMALVPKSIAFLPALPFYFMELLVGFVQALVFTLLCAIFLKLICDHGDHDHDHAEEGHH